MPFDETAGLGPSFVPWPKVAGGEYKRPSSLPFCTLQHLSVANEWTPKKETHDAGLYRSER